MPAVLGKTPPSDLFVSKFDIFVKARFPPSQVLVAKHAAFSVTTCDSHSVARIQKAEHGARSKRGAMAAISRKGSASSDLLFVFFGAGLLSWGCGWLRSPVRTGGTLGDHNVCRCIAEANQKPGFLNAAKWMFSTIHSSGGTKQTPTVASKTPTQRHLSKLGFMNPG